MTASGTEPLGGFDLTAELLSTERPTWAATLSRDTVQLVNVADYYTACGICRTFGFDLVGPNVEQDGQIEGGQWLVQAPECIQWVLEAGQDILLQVFGDLRATLAIEQP